MYSGRSYLDEIANQTVEWYSTDNQEVYQHNLKHRKHDLEKYNWIDANITYSFNSHGFRSDEFTDAPSVLFLGCSYTTGIGLPIEAAWPSIVADELKLTSHNLSIPGTSSDTAFRLGHHWIPKLQPKLVIHLVTHSHRLELLLSDNCYNFLPNEKSRYQTFYNDWLRCDDNMNINSLKNCMGLDFICNKLSIKILQINYKELINIDPARDLAHAGVQSNANFARKVLTTI